jgi:hypothetical protein
MKNMTIVSLVIAALVLIQPIQASAINKEWSAVLGFVGGYMVGNGGACQRTVVREQPVYVERPVYVEQPIVREVVVEQPVVTGHYEYRQQQIWVPGCWTYVQTPCGYEQMWRPGCYRMQTITVWVQDCGQPRHHRGRH